MNRITVDFGVILDSLYVLPITVTLLSLVLAYALVTVIVLYFGRK